MSFVQSNFLVASFFVLDPENHRISASPPSFMRRVPVHSFANPIVFSAKRERNKASEFMTCMILIYAKGVRGPPFMTSTFEDSKWLLKKMTTVYLYALACHVRW